MDKLDKLKAKLERHFENEVAFLNEIDELTGAEARELHTWMLANESYRKLVERGIKKKKRKWWRMQVVYWSISILLWVFIGIPFLILRPLLPRAWRKRIGNLFKRLGQRFEEKAR